MVAVFLQNSASLIVNPLVHGFAITNGGRLICPTCLYLEIETQLVRRDKRCLRRAIGMETKHIQTMGLGYFDDSRPFARGCWRVACQRENAALQRAAEKGLATVERKLSSFRSQITKSK